MTALSPIDASRLWILVQSERLRRLTTERRARELAALHRAFEARVFTTTEVAADAALCAALGVPPGNGVRAARALSSIRAAGMQRGLLLVNLTGRRPARWQVTHASPLT